LKRGLSGSSRRAADRQLALVWLLFTIVLAGDAKRVAELFEQWLARRSPGALCEHKRLDEQHRRNYRGDEQASPLARFEHELLRHPGIH
jgi:hypothetical protein